MAKGYSGGKAGGSYSGGGLGGSYKGARMSSASYGGAGMPSSSYGSSSSGAVNYSANLTITSPNGQTINYSQSLSIPYTPGTSVSYGSRLEVGNATYGSKSISDLVQPYSARSAGKAKQSSRYPLAGLDRNARQGKPYSLAKLAGYDGASHMQGYAMGQAFREKMFDKITRDFENMKHVKQYNEDEVEKDKKREKGKCMKCGEPSFRDGLCFLCLQKVNYQEVN